MFLIMMIGFGIIVGIFDVVIVCQLYGQWDASARYQPVRARILESFVETERSSGRNGGTSYSAVVRYFYEVDGREHTSDRVSYVSWGTSDYDGIASIVDAYPVDAEVDAWFDPDAPSESVLRLGLDDFPWVTFLFLTPFHCVIGVLWLVRRRQRSVSTPEGLMAEMVFFDDGSVAALRTPPLGWLVMFFAVMGVGGFAGTFIVMFTSGILGGAGLVLPLLAGLGCAAAGAAAWWRARQRSLFVQALFDRTQRVCQPPKSRRAIPFDEVTDVMLEERVVGNSNGRPIFHHDVMLVTGDGKDVRVVTVPGSEEAAQPAVAWVRETVGLRPEQG